MRNNLILALTLLLLSLAPAAQAAQVVFNAPDFDRWMYSFNSSNGVRSTAPVFGAVGSSTSDEFNGQFLVGFNTEAQGIPTAGTLPPGMKYQINSVSVTATHSTGSFVYDATFDSYASYLDPGDPDFVADSTPGRPIELYGVDLRNGYTSLGFGPTVPGPAVFEEGDVYALGPPTGKNVRSAYAYDPLYGDVSNPVADALFNLEPWAVGQTNLSPGSSVVQGVAGVSPGSTFTFNLDLSRTEIVDYLTDGLAGGGLFFSIATLMDTEQGGGFNPNFYTRDNFDPAAVPATLVVDYELVPVPEPATLALVLCGACAAGPYVLRRVRRRGRAVQS